MSVNRVRVLTFGRPRPVKASLPAPTTELRRRSTSGAERCRALVDDFIRTRPRDLDALEMWLRRVTVPTAPPKNYRRSRRSSAKFEYQGRSVSDVSDRLDAIGDRTAVTTDLVRLFGQKKHPA